MATEGYCVKCKAKVVIKDPKESKTAKGTKIAKGKCPKCGGKLHKNLLGFHNCGACFSNMANDMLGEDDY